jgi:hypothetical protein
MQFARNGGGGSYIMLQDNGDNPWYMTQGTAVNGLAFFYNTPGSSTPVLSMGSNGYVGIGNDNSPVALLTVGASDQFQVNSTGAIAAATGITSSGTITFSALNTNGGLIWANGSGVLAQTAAGTSGQALISGGAGSPTYFAPTAGSVLFAGVGGKLEQDNASLFFDDTNNRLGLGTVTPNKQLEIFGTNNALRLSYDVELQYAFDLIGRRFDAHQLQCFRGRIRYRHRFCA